MLQREEEIQRQVPEGYVFVGLYGMSSSLNTLKKYFMMKHRTKVPIEIVLRVELFKWYKEFVECFDNGVSAEATNHLKVSVLPVEGQPQTSIYLSLWAINFLSEMAKFYRLGSSETSAIIKKCLDQASTQAKDILEENTSRRVRKPFSMQNHSFSTGFDLTEATPKQRMFHEQYVQI